MPSERTLRIVGAVWFGVALIVIISLPRTWWIAGNTPSLHTPWLWFEAKLWLAPAYLLVITGTLPGAAIAAIVWVTYLMDNGRHWQANDWFHMIVPAMLVAAAVWSEIRNRNKKEVIVPNQPPTVERRPEPGPSPLDHG